MDMLVTSNTDADRRVGTPGLIPPKAEFILPKAKAAAESENKKDGGATTVPQATGRGAGTLR